MGRSAYLPLSLCAVLAVGAVLLLPGAGGPFSATHGPATAFRAARYASAVLHSIRLVAELAPRFLIGAATVLLGLRLRPRPAPEFPGPLIPISAPPAQVPVLLC